ncbi:unnamed protein product [Euphydryas editha]|uniref:Cilia- and flagella-associated protein 69 ARM repeats domain-containing protein n=1 Tax=Euphydryas editha TaxID=104508 RepID=A0AAU9UV62_EUPED|nr:unnamed protein product [Euphydryas editha]
MLLFLYMGLLIIIFLPLSIIGVVGSLLVITEEDEMFELVARALTWQLSAGGEARGAGTARRQLVLGAARALMHTAPRMLALASSRRFPTFLQIALLLACDSDDYCIEMIKENIIENIFYRFNPYFPHDELPAYEFDPADPQDYNVKLGDSSINMATTLSLLLVLLQTLKNHLNVNPNCRAILPCPNYYAQRCFIWAYRFECRAREHRHERSALTVVAHALLHCFGDRLVAFSSLLMPDVMTLSVLTEIPRRRDWTGTVNFNTSQADVHFKKLLIHLCVDFLKILPANSFMVECRHWLLGLMFLLDPCLSPLRAHWSPALFAEIRKTGLQALVCTLPIIPQRLIQEYDIIRRVLWYIEWYSESPYELPTLYWSVRLLRAATRDRQESLEDLFNTHGVIILTYLCYTLLEQKRPPVERSQAVLALALRVLAETGEERSLRCCVYALRWPAAGCALAHRMLAVVLFALNNHLIITDRWLLSLLNFIWEAIVWNKEHRQTFVLKNGVYNLLDIIAMSKPAVQCLALALLCELARGGDAAAQLVTWRAGLAPSGTYPCVAKCGSSIACLLAAVFREECLSSGVLLDERGVIQNIDSPLQSLELRNEMNNLVYREAKSDRTPVCWPAADAAGSRASKAFALLQLLSEDLKHKVALADETYNLYKNIRLEPEDEVILVLCSHYLTIKLNETWVETKLQSPGLLKQDEIILDEFLEINKGWAEEIRRQQLDVLEKNHKKEAEEESTLYEFLRRVRLTSALDALREVRCAASSASAPRRARPTVAVAPSDSGASLVRTYRPPLDEQARSHFILIQYLTITALNTRVTKILVF